MHSRATSVAQSFTVLGLVLVGCASNGAAPSSTTDCSALADAYCAKFEACAPALALFFFGDGTTCADYIGAQCDISARAPGTGFTSAIARACIRETGDASCDRFLAGDLVGTSCGPHGGAVHAGGACGDDWQCASGKCSATPSDSGCGVCLARVPSGGVCTRDECEPGLDCVFGAATGTCLPPYPAGGSCDSTRSCAAGTICQRQSANSDRGLCQPPRRVGESCSPGVIACDYLHNAQCNPGTNVCELPAATIQPGQPCGWINGHYDFCYGTCAQASPSALSGTCVGLDPVVAEGLPCTPADRCALGTSCSNGLCSPRNPSMCSAPGS